MGHLVPVNHRTPRGYIRRMHATRVNGTWRRRALTLGLIGLVLTGCISETTTSTAETTAIAATIASSAPAASSGLERVAAATLLVETEGSFSEFGEDEYEMYWGGSAFFIDSSGVAVTNHHVVGGASIVRVFVSGEDQPRNARILGVSECSDLAVIKVDGDGFTALDWYRDTVTPGLEVYAAGYPDDYGLTRGIITRAPYRADTSWASTDGVLDHDARLLSGNSGGPLVTFDGRVVGVNYAGTDVAVQSSAIGATAASALVDRLIFGDAIDTIGVTGTAFEDLDEDLRGVWVSAVATGSPAYSTGVRPGDVIVRLQNLAVGRDGTMAGYCEVLRSTRPGDQLRIEIFRPTTEQFLVGELNGEQLTESTSFGAGTEASRPSVDESFVTVTDDSGRIQVEVPARWADIDGSSYRDNRGNLIYDIVVAEDVDGFIETWDVSGVRISASYDLARSTNEIAVLEDLFEFFADLCEFDGTEPYSDPFYSGEFDVFRDCEGSGTDAYVLAVVPTHRSFVIWIEALVRTTRDLAALDRILASFVFQ